MDRDVTYISAFLVVFAAMFIVCAGLAAPQFAASHEKMAHEMDWEVKGRAPVSAEEQAAIDETIKLQQLCSFALMDPRGPEHKYTDEEIRETMKALGLKTTR